MTDLEMNALEMNIAVMIGIVVMIDITMKTLNLKYILQ
jgi:hypothetical protein